MEKLLNSQEASAYTGFSNKYFRTLCNQGKIKYAFTGKGQGRRLFFKLEWLDDYLNRKTKEMVIVEVSDD